MTSPATTTAIPCHSHTAADPINSDGVYTWDKVGHRPNLHTTAVRVNQSVAFSIIYRAFQIFYYILFIFLVLVILLLAFVFYFIYF